MKSSEIANESSYTILKNEIEEAFGKKVYSYGDCLILSEEIYVKFSIKISSNTLRRFFGLIKTDSLPSATTLDILSRYCGFNSFDEFMKLKEGKHKVNMKSHNEYYFHSILYYLFSLFRTAPVKDFNNRTFNTIVKHTILFLQRHPELIEKFQKVISKLKNGQDFYYEQFIDIDRLNSFYGEGLRYYLIEKKTPEAQIFGHSLLCLKSWLSENSGEVKRHYDEVIKYRPEKNLHPSLCGRFFATQLLYADVYGLPAEKIVTAAQQSYTSIKHKASDQIFPYFEYVILPVLLLTGHAEKALNYIAYFPGTYPKRHDDIEEGFYQTMNLLKALTLVKTGRKKEAEKLYQQISFSKFYFLTKKTDTIMYLFLSRHLKKNNVKSAQQLNELINETGFTRLHRIFNEERQVTEVEK